MKARSALACATLTALGAGAAIVASGCGGASSTIDPVAQAAIATSHAGGARVAFKASVTVPGLGSPLAMEGGGNFNFKANEGILTMDMTGLPSAAVAKLGSGSVHMSELYKAGTVYVGSSLLDGKLPGGARWIKLDLGGLLQAEGLSASSLTSGGPDPSQYLQYLESEGAKLSVTGHDSVRGVPTTRWAGTINLVKAAEAQASGNKAQARANFEKVTGATSATEIPVEVWIDAKHLVRRESLTISLSPEGHATQTKMSIENYDFGPTPTVNAPSGSEVYDVTKQSEQNLPGA
jgi:hypothetical protein